jgi:anti-sigma-K factor RskA
MPESSHVFESLPAYALGSLDADEARLVAEHLNGCHACRSELRAFERVAGQLSSALPHGHPSEGLKPRLMERIQNVDLKRRAPSKSWSGRLVPLGAFAGLLLIVSLLVTNFVLWQKLEHAEFIRGPLGMRAIPLENSETVPGASGIVVIGADGRNGVLVVDQLPPLDEAHQYQAWLMRDGVSTSAAILSVDESGYRGVRITAPESLTMYSEIKVTVEPAGGNGEPSGERVLGGSLFNDP